MIANGSPPGTKTTITMVTAIANILTIPLIASPTLVFLA
jgi:hypothetical protein